MAEVQPLACFIRYFPHLLRLLVRVSGAPAGDAWCRHGAGGGVARPNPFNVVRVSPDLTFSSRQALCLQLRY